MKKEWLKKYLPYLVALVVFVAIVLIYCFPALEGQTLYASDTQSFKGMSNELKTYKKETGETAWWTNSMFSGMPSYQITGSTTATTILVHCRNFVSLGTWHYSPMNAILLYLICFFILLRAFNVNKWLSIIGSIAISFSSYFFIILAAGHLTKPVSLAYTSVIIAGFIFIFRKRYFLGVALTMIAAALGFMPHIQMSYYLFLMLGIFAVAELYIHLKEKRIKDLILGVVVFALSFGVGIGTNYDKMVANSEYLKETMRGGHSELTKPENQETLANGSGLSLEYATQWSYGISETMTLMIPNCYGGSSHYHLGENSETYKQLINNRVPRKTAQDFCQQLPLYWGPQPFTAGPVYVGAIICFLFILGLLIVKGPYKWALLAATIFSILLSWGNHFMWLTELFFKYFPMYSKFRAVSSILVVAEISIPVLAVLALKTIMDNGISRQKLLQRLYISFGFTGAICLFIALFGKNIFSFSSPNDAQMFAQIPHWLADAIVAERANLLQADAFRSCIFIVLSAVVLWLFVQQKMKSSWMIISLGILILADMWTVNKRFFNDSNFVPKKNTENDFVMYPYEKQLLNDTSYFRVMNLTTNTFNDARTSYYLKSIGGYHGAKLRRYQDIIEEHFSKNNRNVFDMLNAKYFIVKGQDGQPQVQINPRALGNAWFIDTLKVVQTPDEESEALRVINPAITAVTDQKFEPILQNLVTPFDSAATIQLTKYAPDALEYHSVSTINKTAVFSDIYYPYGWNAYIDGKPVEHFRVNYVLRALDIPAGTHDIRFEFRPKSIYQGSKVAITFVILMFCVTVVCIAYPLWKKYRKAPIGQ